MANNNNNWIINMLKSIFGGKKDGPKKEKRVDMYQGPKNPSDVIFNAANDADEDEYMPLVDETFTPVTDELVPPGNWGGNAPALNVGVDPQGRLRRHQELMNAAIEADRMKNESERRQKPFNSGPIM